MMRAHATKLAPVATFALVLVLAGAPADAVSVRDWDVSTAAGFAGGTLDGTTVDERGRLALAPGLETVFGPDEGIVWDVAPAGAGEAFVALSGPGRVLLVRRGAPAQVWYEGGDDTLVTALTPDGEGGVFAGLSPSGTVLHLTSPGQVAAEAETRATFVWALDTDLAGGVWIGTGVPGGVARWTPGTDVQSLFDTGDDPVRSVLALARSTLVVGTGGRGRLIRLNDQGRAFVLFDADEKEIVDLAVDDDGVVFALAAGGAVQVKPRGATADAVERNASNSVSVTATPPPGTATGNGSEKEDEQRQPAPAPAGLTAPKGGALYRVDPDGHARRLWQSASEIPFALLRTEDGRLLAATGDGGRIHVLDADGHAGRLLRVPSNQASALALGPDGSIIVGASSDARVALLGPGVGERGEWTSAAIDAGTVAEWGRVRWEVVRGRGGSVVAAVRVGNSEEPDETWSDWIELPTKSGHDVEADAPPARWMQVRLTLRGRGDTSPAVSKVAAFYTPRNRPPQVTELKIDAAGIVWVRGPVNTASMLGPLVADDPVARRAADQLTRKTARPIRRTYELGSRTFSWKAEDPDDDRLTYLVEIRSDASEVWFPLAGHLEDQFYSWDARSMPDGLYRIRVTARDGRDNPGGKELSHRTVSEAFRIDNTRPTVARPRVERADGGFEVSFVASDPDGKISAVEFALDGGDWKPLDPTDGVADSAEEQYRMRIEPGSDPAAPRYLRVRVADTVGNLGGDAWLVPEPPKK